MSDPVAIQPSRPFRGAALLKNLIPYVGAIVVAFLAVGVFLAFAGFDVLEAYATILLSSFRSPSSLVATLLKFIPLLLQALAFTIPLAAGKFNIGGEGQMILGAIGAAGVGIVFASLPAPILLPLVILAGIFFGAVWGALPAWLLYRFRVNEILTTVLLNFVSFNLLNYVATQVWPDPAAGHPTTVPIGDGGNMPMLIPNPPLNFGFVVAILVAVAAYVYVDRSVAGYEMVVTGANPRASQVFGINTRRIWFITLTLGGAIAGLAGAIEISGNHHRLIEGLQSNFLILGIIIGLIAKGNNLAVPFVAFFIAVLEVGASALQRTMQIPSEMVFIVEALILLFVLLSDVLRRKS